MSQSPRIGSCLQRMLFGNMTLNLNCLNPLESGHVFRECVGGRTHQERNVSIPSNRVMSSEIVLDTWAAEQRWSQSPRIGSCLQRKPDGSAVCSCKSLNPLESGHVFRDCLKQTTVSGWTTSQSPRIGSCLQSRKKKIRDFS